MKRKTRNGNGPLPTATWGETIALLTEVIVPTLAKGVIKRRPRVVRMAETLELDSRAVRRMQQLRDRYGTGPLMLRVPIRNQAVILDPDHVFHVLDRSPEPFATASDEKHAALSHFQPEGALISDPPERYDRRRFNEEVLQSESPVHAMAGHFVPVVQEEALHLLQEVRRGGGELRWEAFFETWFRVVRRVVFGEAARDDHELTDLIAELRADANWAFMKPRQDDVRERFFARMRDYLRRAEPGSLAGMMKGVHTTPHTAPAHQVPQWLFAFDPAGMTTFRALALLASHPEHAARARREVRGSLDATDHPLPYLRACLLESLRLWPTTPMVLRKTTADTRWENGVMPADTGVLIFAPFFHRDDRVLPFAHRFAPELWLDANDGDQAVPPREWPLIPFSGGPAICPGRNLVLLLTTAIMAELIRDRELRLKPPRRLREGKRLPGTLNPYALRFELYG